MSSLDSFLRLQINPYQNSTCSISKSPTIDDFQEFQNKTDKDVFVNVKPVNNAAIDEFLNIFKQT